MKRLLLLLLAAFAAQAAAQRTNDPGEVSGPQLRGGPDSQDDRRMPQEGAVALPAWPKNENLIEFRVSSASNFRFFIDAASLSVGADRVVRYTLVARSASGVANVSYEGIRCETGSYKVFAYGSDGRWSARESEWRDIEPKGIARWHFELRMNYLCRDRTGALFSANEGLDALRRGHTPGVPGASRLNY